MQPFLSVIIPAHNEESRLKGSLQQLRKFLKEQSYTSEVLVVENGSQDQTFQVGMEISKEMPNLRILQLDKAGKGFAVRSGVMASSGQYRMIADADFSMPVEEINLFLPPNQDTDICIASRELPESVRFDEPALRHFIGRVFNFMIRKLVLPGLQDTQCGFKCFKGETAEDIFKLQSLDGWAFDVEVLKIARLHGWQIKEIPINWYYFPGSKVNVIPDSIRMFRDLLIIRRKARRGDYARQD
ncbi:dolichyl-phosphate beta-glucosyltransferase [Chloroflexota bacterium]